MLRNPPVSDWLNWRRTDNNWGYSTLTEINKQNVQVSVAYVARVVLIDSTVPAQKNLAYDAALILVVLVLALVLSARLIVWLSQKYSPNRAVARPNRETRRRTRELAAGKATGELANGRSQD